MVSREALVRLMVPSLIVSPLCLVTSKVPATSTKPLMFMSRLPLTFKSSVLTKPAKPLTTPSVVRSSQLSLTGAALLSATLYCRSSARTFSSKVDGSPTIPMESTCAATAVQLRGAGSVVGSSDKIARSRLALLTWKPTVLFSK